MTRRPLGRNDVTISPQSSSPSLKAALSRSLTLCNASHEPRAVERLKQILVKKGVKFLDEPDCFGIDYPPDPRALAQLIAEIQSSTLKRPFD